MKSLILLTFLIKMHDAMKYDQDQQSWERISRSSDVTFKNASEHIQRAEGHEDGIQRRQASPAGGKCVMGFCEEVSDYPEDKVNNLLDQYKEYESLFNMPMPDLAMRASEDENSCNSSSFVTYPRSAVNLKNESVLIASTDRYKQRIQVELCGQIDGPCAYSTLLPQSYESKCVQEYTRVPLVSLDHDIKLKLDFFSVPSCCVCTVRAG